MRLFIVDKKSAESEIGADNLKTAHQICYKQLQLSLTDRKIPIELHAAYSFDCGASFVFVKYDPISEMYFYRMTFTTAG